MNSVCISSCIDDARDTRVPVRTTYVNLYKWPESDAEFVRSVRRGGGVPAARVVDSISCRQMYLRSYTFSRDDDDKSKAEKVLPSATRTSCLGRVKEAASLRRENKEESDVIVEKGKPRRRREKGRVRKKKREQACSVMFRFFRRLLSCAATVRFRATKVKAFLFLPTRYTHRTKDGTRTRSNFNQRTHKKKQTKVKQRKKMKNEKRTEHTKL